MSQKRTLKMKMLLLIAFLCLCQFGCGFASNYESIVENSIGELLLLHDKKHSYQLDKNPFGSGEIYYNEFLTIYKEKIKNLPEAQRVDFFWACMWHLGFDGHDMEEFQALIMQDCGEQFIARLQKYVDDEKELKRDKSRLYLSEKVLAGLKMIQERLKP